MEKRKVKTSGESVVETRYLVMPDQVNTYGTVFGGVIMSWIDMVAGMVAQRHSEGVSVTASIDQIVFITPICVGDHVILKASVNYVGTTSMEIGVRVTREDPVTGQRIHATTAFLTFVGLDEKRCPRIIPDIKPETEEERLRYTHAKLRVEARKELHRKIKADKERMLE